jgi:DNA-binding HxlR family transcriptional regulator
VDHDFVDVEAVGQGRDLLGRCGGVADDEGLAEGVDDGTQCIRDREFGGFLREELASEGLAGFEAGQYVQLREGQEVRFLGGVRDDGVDDDERLRLGELPRRAERAPVRRQGPLRAVPGEVVREDEGPARPCGRLGRVGAGAQQPHLGHAHGSWSGLEVVGARLPRVTDLEIQAAPGHHRGELLDLLRVPVAPFVAAAAAQQEGRDAVAAGGASDTQVDTARERRLKEGEVLRDGQGAVVRQLDAARAHSDAFRRRRDEPEEHGRIGGHEAGDVVVLADPVAAVTEGVGPLCQGCGGSDRVTAGLLGTDQDMVEYRQGGHEETHSRQTFLVAGARRPGHLVGAKIEPSGFDFSSNGLRAVKLPSRISLEDRESPLCAAAQHVCEWWTLLILQDAFDGYSRFDQFQENLGVSSSMLTTRLKALVADGLLERRPYQTNPVRHEYVLTALGRSLWPVIVALTAWGNSRLAPEERSMVLIEAATGEEVDPAVVDAVTGRRLDDSDAYVFTAGPAASDAMRARYRHRKREAAKRLSAGAQ